MSMLLTPEGKLRPGLSFLVSLFVTVVAFQLSFLLTRTLVHGSLASADALNRSITALLLIAAYAAMLYVFQHEHSGLLSRQGLPLRKPWLLQTASGITLGAAAIAVAGVVIAVVGRLRLFPSSEGGGASALLVTVCTLASGAMVEELVFRGYPFQRLVEAISAPGAILLVSAMFAGIHIKNPNASIFGLANTVLVGIVFSVAYLRTKSLWLPWGMHFAWNLALGVVLGLPVSGITSFAWKVKGAALGPVWLTGGLYGVEGGASGTLAIAAMLLLVIWVTRSQSMAYVAPPPSLSTDIRLVPESVAAAETPEDETPRPDSSSGI